MDRVNEGSEVSAREEAEGGRSAAINALHRRLLKERGGDARSRAAVPRPEMTEYPDGRGSASEPRRGEGIEWIRALWRRHRWLTTICFALPFAAMTPVALSLPGIYKSTATVLVERQQVPEAFVRPTVTSELDFRLHTISQEILSRWRLEELINRFGLYAGLRGLRSSEEVVEQMRRDIRLELKMSEKGGQTGATTAFAISYRGRDPKTVAVVTNALASLYIEENLKVRALQATGTAQFLEAQLADTKKRLDEQEGRVTDFRRRHMGELPQQMPANLASLEALTAQLRLNSDNQVRAAERRDAIRAQLTEVLSFGPDPSAPGSRPDPRAARMQLLMDELTAARTRYTERHPTVARLKEEIAAMEHQLAAAPSPQSPDGTPASAVPRAPYVLKVRENLQAAEAETKILKAEEERLRRAIASYQARVENTPKREQESQELTRDYEATKDLYASLGKRYDEAQIAESMEQRQKGEQFRLLDPAIASAKPAAPNRMRLLFVSLAVSLVCAAGAVALAEMLDTSLHSIDDLRALTSVPVLVSIPSIRTGADLRRERWRFRFAAAAVLLSIIVLASASYYIAHGNEYLLEMLARGRA